MADGAFPHRALFAAAAIVRTFLTPHWGSWHREWGSPAPMCLAQWTCVRSSAFLARALHDAGCAASFASGIPVREGLAGDECGAGIRASTGWHSHAWITAGGALIDITGDQFGRNAVVVTCTDDPAYRGSDYPGAQLRLTDKGSAAVDRAWHGWCRHADRLRLQTILAKF